MKERQAIHCQAIHGQPRRVQAIFVVLFTLLWTSMVGRQAAAHGIDRLLRTQDQLAGGYSSTVWTSPSRLRPGEVHVDVQVAGADGTLTTAHFVNVRITSLEGSGLSQQTIAHPLEITGMENNPATHEARFRLEETGSFEVSVAVADQQSYLGGATFDIEVTPVSLATKLTLHVLLVLSLVATYWIARIGLALWFPAGLLSKAQTTVVE